MPADSAGSVTSYAGSGTKDTGFSAVTELEYIAAYAGTAGHGQLKVYLGWAFQPGGHIEVRGMRPLSGTHQQ